MPILEAQLKTALWIAEENLPNRKFLKLIDRQLSNGAAIFSNKKGIYSNHQAPATFQKYIADVLKETAMVRISLNLGIAHLLDVYPQKTLCTLYL